MRFSKALVISSLGLLFASSAIAQQIGTYTGTTQDGSSVTITVAQDPNNANLEVKVLGFGVNMLCRKSKENLNYIGIGLSDGADIADKKFSYVSSTFTFIDLVTNMTFKGNSVSGKVAGNVSVFNPAIGHTTLTNNVQACDSPKQPFTATFSGAPKSLQPPKAAMTVSDGRSTIRIGTVPAP